MNEDQGFSSNTKVADYSLNDEIKNIDIEVLILI